MRTAKVVRLVAVCGLACGLSAAAQDRADRDNRENTTADRLTSVGDHERTAVSEAQTRGDTKTIIERVFKREKEEEEIIASYTPIVETYIQVEKSDALIGTVPKSDFYFLGIADYHKSRIHVRSMTDQTHKGNFIWSFEPAGFLQMGFLDWGGFDKEHYRVIPAGRAFLGEVRCYVFDVRRAPKAKGPRFEGRIWVEDQDFTMVRMNGSYAPEIHFSFKRLEDDFYLHFDSWRTNVALGVWLPSDIFSQEMGEPVPTGGPRFKARTHLWGYGITTKSREEELGRLLVETEGQVKDESDRQDRSPLEQQRDWRELAESNVLDVLERAGLIAPKGDVEKVLDTVVNNIMVTNTFDSRIDFHCRVLMTSDFELFSMQKTIVLSRGLIDVVPNEETLGALVAFEIADGMVPKPREDQYGFSDILRLTPTEALKKLSFVDTTDEARKNSEKALEWLKKSPYGEKLGNAGLFLSQLQSQRPALKQLINARLGNQVYFASQLLQSAQPLDAASLRQVSALPMGSRIKINAWSDALTLIKTQQMGPVSPREKIPFEVTPIDLHLTRYVQVSGNDGEHSIVPKSAFPVAVAAGEN